MIITTLKTRTLTFNAESPELLTTERILEWEEDIPFETEELTAIDKQSGDRFEYVDGKWVAA